MSEINLTGCKTKIKQISCFPWLKIYSHVKKIIYILLQCSALDKNKNELPHDKTNNVAVHPVKTQISLGIRPVWSESSLCAQWVAKDPSFIHAVLSWGSSNQLECNKTYKIMRVEQRLRSASAAKAFWSFLTWYSVGSQGRNVVSRWECVDNNFLAIDKIDTVSVNTVANRVDPDQTAPDLGLHCLIRHVCLKT